MRVERIQDATLYLANCLTVIPTLECVDHVITDPPYEAIIHDSNKRLAAGGQLRDKRNPFNAFAFEPIDEIRDDFIQAIEGRFAKWLIAFCIAEGAGKWADAITASTIKYKRACLWIKPDGMPQFNGQCPGIGYECFVTAWGGRGHSQWNGGGKHGVYTFNKDSGNKESSHPTEKPIKLMDKILLDFTQSGDLVLDPFMGSGTTGVACARLGRRFIGIELDEKHFNTACRRIEAAYRQPRLFAEPTPKPQQMALVP